MAYTFTSGDYTYTPINETETIGGIVSTSGNYSFTHTPAITDRYGDGDAYNRWIYVYVFQEDEGETAFVYGTSSSTRVRQCKIMYDGSNTISIVNGAGSGGPTADVSISVPYSTGNTACQATDKTKSNYSNIPNSVSNSNITYTVTNLRACFSDCTNLITSPTIPSSVTNMFHCFNGCIKLTTAPTIPNSVTNMDSCFAGCIKLTTPPAIPNSVTNMFWCFNGCIKLTTAPTIPSSVTNMKGCFQNCRLLTGNIVVNNSLTSSTSKEQIFSSTSQDIYIINGQASGSAHDAIEATWKNDIAPLYLNVHYEADDNPMPAISNFTALRVANNGSTTYDNNGTYVYLSATINIYTTAIPSGWTNSLSAIAFTKDGVSASWSIPTISSYPYPLTTWINLADLARHSFTLSITDNIKSNNVTKASRTSNIVSTILPKRAILLDFIHENNKEGIAIGSYATQADLFDISMDTIFRYNIQADLIDSTISDTADYKLYHALLALGWDDCLSTNT